MTRDLSRMSCAPGSGDGPAICSACVRGPPRGANAAYLRLPTSRACHSAPMQTASPTLPVKNMTTATRPGLAITSQTRACASSLTEIAASATLNPDQCRRGYRMRGAAGIRCGGAKRGLERAGRWTSRMRGDKLADTWTCHAAASEGRQEHERVAFLPRPSGMVPHSQRDEHGESRHAAVCGIWPATRSGTLVASMSLDISVVLGTTVLPAGRRCPLVVVARTSHCPLVSTPFLPCSHGDSRRERNQV